MINNGSQAPGPCCPGCSLKQFAEAITEIGHDADDLLACDLAGGLFEGGLIGVDGVARVQAAFELVHHAAEAASQLIDDTLVQGHEEEDVDNDEL